MTDGDPQMNAPGSLEGEEARLRWMSKVFMDAADPILIEDLDGNVIDMNCEAEEMELEGFAPDLERIHGAGRHLLSLINDILDLSKIEAGRMELFLENFDLAELVDDVASTVDALVEKNRNRFSVKKSEGLGSVRADLTKVRQMLFNLISNASKFTKDGQIDLLVERRVARDGEWIHYSVKDSGIGVPPDKIGSLFEEFSQADASTTRDYGGTGLGLAITKRFCEMMGGSITVESEPGRGSTFTIRLPAQVEQAAHEAAASPEPTPGGCVLVIDDDAVARDLIRRALERDGLEVALAGNGDEGLHLARELRPLLITLDVMMPGRDGWSVLRELKADPDLREIPVVMISMLDGGDMGFALGATDFVTKPVARNDLREVLRRHGVLPSGQVLVVDDEEPARTLLRRILEQEECTVVESANGKEALERIRERKPDLIVLDLMMPVMDGFEFAKELRAVDEWRHIPVIVSTAKELTADEHAELSSSVEGILQKNASDLEELISEVHRTLTARRKQSEDL